LQIHIPIDPLTKESKGLAFVTYVQSQDALTALRTLDGKSFQGRLLHIIGAIDRNINAASAEGSNKPKTLKEQRKEKRKVVAGKEFNWSMLYMNVSVIVGLMTILLSSIHRAMPSYPQWLIV
jgi:multiple RNA-binding domain-containing protein 1